MKFSSLQLYTQAILNNALQWFSSSQMQKRWKDEPLSKYDIGFILILVIGKLSPQLGKSRWFSISVSYKKSSMSDPSELTQAEEGWTDVDKETVQHNGGKDNSLQGTFGSYGNLRKLTNLMDRSAGP